MRNIFKLSALAIFTFAFAGTSHALTYEFGSTRVIAGVFEEGADPGDRTAIRDHFYTKSATSRLDFNSDSGVVQIAINGVAGTGKASYVENEFQWVQGSWAESEYSLTFEITNATEVLGNSGEIVGYLADGATSSGTFKMDSIGGRSFDADLEFKKMNFSSFAGQGGWREQVSDHGDVLFFAINDLTSGDFISKGWFSGVGTDGRYIGGDIHLANGAEVPEPMTAALLGMGLLGGAVKRKKQKAE